MARMEDQEEKPDIEKMLLADAVAASCLKIDSLLDMGYYVDVDPNENEILIKA